MVSNVDKIKKASIYSGAFLKSKLHRIAIAAEVLSTKRDE